MLIHFSEYVSMLGFFFDHCLAFINIVYLLSPTRNADVIWKGLLMFPWL